MEDKIEVGEYVRSKLGSIGKVTKIEDNKFLYEDKCLICFISNVVKHSKNIIKLIKAGDYVNGDLVTEVYDEMVQCLDGEVEYWENEIQRVVTHEQFESMEYKV